MKTTKLIIGAFFLSALCLTACTKCPECETCKVEKEPKAGDVILKKNHTEYVLNDDLMTISAQTSLNGVYDDEASETPNYRVILPRINNKYTVTDVYFFVHSFTPTPNLYICLYTNEAGEYQGDYVKLGKANLINTADAVTYTSVNISYYGTWDLNLAK